MKQHLSKILLMPIMLLICTFSTNTCFAENYATVINHTECIYNMDTFKVGITKPVNVYDFVGTNYKPIYSGNYVAPYETKKVPMGATNSSNEPVLLLGANPNDSPSHITMVGIPPNESCVVVQYSGGACKKDSPCLFVSEYIADECKKLLASQ